MINRFHHSEKNVRRNLKFTETPPTARRTKHFVRVSTSNLHNKSTVSERSLQTHRKSFILPPNSIRNMHVAQNSSKQSRSIFPHLNQERILTEKSVSKYPRISEESESSSPFVEDADALVNNPIVQEKNNKTSVIQHTSLQTFKMNDRPVTSILYSSNSHSNANDAMEKTNRKHSNIDKALYVNVCNKQNSDDDVTIDKPQVPSMYNVDTKKDVNLHNGRYLNLETNAIYTPGVEKITIEDMHVPLQAIKKMSKSCVDLQRGIDDDREYVILSKKELTILTCSLESHMNLIRRLEENISHLKLTSINIMNLLSTKTASKVTNDNKIEIKKQMTENITGNAEVINNASTILPPNDQILVTEVNHNSESTSTTLGSDALICTETNVPEATKDHVKTQPSRQIDFTPVDNKENEKGTSLSVKHSKPRCGTRRRSARLMAKALKNSNVDNDSFVNLEHELNIASKEPATPIVSRMDHTPLMSGRKDKKTGRPWKEYMAMKSRMSCLLTPNIKRLNSTESNNIRPETGGTRSLSSKILADLQNLYSDSPDLQ